VRPGVAIPGDTQVSLSWNGVAGASHYNVRRATTRGGPYTPHVGGDRQHRGRRLHPRGDRGLRVPGAL